MIKSTETRKWFRTEEFELNDGDILVYRSNKSGKFWSMRCWISDEKRYFVKSLGVKNKEDAITLSKELYLDLQIKIRSGHQVFDKSVGELVKMFLDEQKLRVREGEVGKGSVGITEGRYKTIKTQVTKHLIGFFDNDKIKGFNGDKTKVSTIRNDTFKHKYYRYRKTKNSNVTDSTIINERCTITSVFKFGVEKEIIQLKQVPIWEEMHKDKTTRDSLSLEEWKEVYTYLRIWSKGDEEQDEIDKKEFVRNFILILCNVGLRLGELRYLKWKNVRLIKERDGNLTSVIDIEISKTGSREGVIGRGGQYFKRVKQISKFTNGNDWIFVDNETGEQLGKKTLYRLWDEVIKNTSLKDRLKNFTYYSLRHTYCTYRLRSGTDIYLLSKNMGTSVTHIQNTYSHVRLMDERHFLTQGKRLTESERVLFDEL